MNDLLKDLQQAIDEMELNDLNINKEDTSYRIQNRSQADYFIRKYRELVENEAEVNQVADDSIRDYKERVEAWRKDRLDTIERSKQFMQGLLKDFAMRDLEGTGKKSIKLPMGSIGFSKQQPEYSYDEEKVIAFLKAKNLDADYVKTRVSETIDKATLKKAGSINGTSLFINDMPVEGVIVTEREDKFVIR